MQRWWVCLLGVGALAARPARAEGPWAEGVLRPSYMSGTYRFADEVNPGYGQTGVLELQAPMDSMAVELGGALGYADSRYFAIGVGPSLTVAATHAELARSSFSTTYLAALSLEVAVRPFGDGLVLRPSVGLAQSSPLSGDTEAIGSADNIFEVETLRGPVVGLAAGWTRGSLGTSLKVSYARLEADRSKFHALVIGVGILVQHWEPGERSRQAQPAR